MLKHLHDSYSNIDTQQITNIFNDRFIFKRAIFENLRNRSFWGKNNTINNSRKIPVRVYNVNRNSFLTGRITSANCVE